MKKIPGWFFSLFALISLFIINSVICSSLNVTETYKWIAIVIMIAVAWATLFLLAESVKQKHPAVAKAIKAFMVLQMLGLLTVLFMGIFGGENTTWHYSF